MDHAKQLRDYADRCIVPEMERNGMRAAAAEIERLRAALQKIADHEYAEADWAITGSRPDTIWEAVARAALRGVNEQTAPTSKCVAEHMGGKRCVEKCLCPKDCCEIPLAALDANGR